MPHNDKIKDTETHFIIDPLSRAITNESAPNNTIVQYDHNSERFTFEIPRYVDGHDMFESTEVRIHYRNASSNNLSKTNGVYIPDDLSMVEGDENTLAFSWLLSSATTQYIGYLHFSIQFVCFNGDIVEYAWNTGIYKDITVIESINNSEVIVEQYPDVLEQWRQELFDAGGDAVVNVNTATENALLAIEAKGEETIDSIPDDYTGVSKTADMADQLSVRNSKCIKNIEAGFATSVPEVDDSVAYEKEVPANALPYAEILKIGGMTYRDTATNTLKHGKVTEVKSVGANHAKFSDKTVSFLGVTCAVTDSVIKITGTGNSSGGRLNRLSDEFMLQAGTYYFGVAFSSFTMDLFISKSDNSIIVSYNKSFVLTEPTVCYISANVVNGTAYNQEVRVMLAKGSQAIPFVPYAEHTLPIPEAVRPALGINGSVYDYIEWEDGGARKAHKLCRAVDLNTLSWSFIGSSGVWTTSSLSGVCVGDVGLSDRYEFIGTTAATVQADKTIQNRGNVIYLKDTSASSANQITGTLLIALATPEVTDISDLITVDNMISVEPGGTVTFVNENGQAVPSEICYRLNKT